MTIGHDASGIFGAGHDGSNGRLRRRGEIGDGACGVGERARHRDRMVRFPDLRHGGRAGAEQAVLPELRSLRRHAGGVLHLCRRLRRAADRRRDHRALRRPARPQEDAGRDHDRHGTRHLPDRLPADLQPDRRLGPDPAHRAALRPGHRAWRRMERCGGHGDRARRQPARLLRQPGADRLSGRRRRVHRHLRAHDEIARSW